MMETIWRSDEKDVSAAMRLLKTDDGKCYVDMMALRTGGKKYFSFLLFGIREYGSFILFPQHR
jgi:hypothetical protein